MATVLRDDDDEVARLIEGYAKATSRLPQSYPKTPWEGSTPVDPGSGTLPGGGAGGGVTESTPLPGPEATPTTPGSGASTPYDWKDPGYQYMHQASQSPGWNPAWDKYKRDLAGYVSGRSVSPGVGGMDWGQISDWYKKSGIPGFAAWQKSSYGPDTPFKPVGPGRMYVDEAASGAGWNPAWDKHRGGIADYVAGRSLGLPSGGLDMQQMADWWAKMTAPKYDDWYKSRFGARGL